MRCCWLIYRERKKATLFGNYQQQQNKRPRLQSTSDSGNQEEITKNAKTDVHMDNPSTPTTATNSLFWYGDDYGKMLGLCEGMFYS